MMNIVDMHCDTLSELLAFEKKGISCELLQNNLHIDLKKMHNAGYLLQNFAMFCDLGNTEDPFQDVMEMTDIFYREMEKNADLIRPVTCVSGIEQNRKEGRMSALLTVEESGVCKGNFALLRNLYRLGVRMITLTWNYPNETGWPNLNNRVKKEERRSDFFRTADCEHGLTETGEAFVHEMERLGMIVDVSHLSDAGFYDVARILNGPFVASHSNARSVCTWSRNLTDDMIRVLAEKGGVTGLNFCPAFLACNEDGSSKSGTIASVVRHAKHIVNVGGSECLGLGSDFDGIESHAELRDASCMPQLIEAFRQEGFSSSQIDKILFGNVLRVYKEVIG